MSTIDLPLYAREGTCQPHQCGSACCRFIALEVNPVYLADADAANWIGLHGIELMERAGRTLARIPVPCSALDQTGNCLLYGQPERPSLCEAYPMTPASLFMVEDVCTFSFTRSTENAT